MHEMIPIMERSKPTVRNSDSSHARKYTVAGRKATSRFS
jgi:hypothetical protein